MRVCLGHYATASHEPPPANSKHVKVLEVTDTDVGPLGASEHLASVVEQLLPTPQRYRLVWHERSAAAAAAPLYLWRPMPPSAQFVALGMVATTSEEPPPLDAVRCLPRRWCAAAAAAKAAAAAAEQPRRLYAQAAQGGRAGGVWATAAPLNLMVATTNAADAAEAASHAFALAAERWVATLKARPIWPITRGSERRIGRGWPKPGAALGLVLPLRAASP